MKNIFILILSLIHSLLVGCSGSNSENKCNQLYTKAQENLNRYYETNENNYLSLAKQFIDSIDCDSYKYKTSNIKITLFTLNKDYKGGIDYIKSLDSSKFYKPYQKKMFLNNFQVLTLKEKGDEESIDSLNREIILEIESYLIKNVDKEALFDLFKIKSKIQSQDSILNDLNLIRRTNEYDHNFLDAIYETVNSESEIKNK